MPLTPTNMRVVDVARLLNSTSQGFVLAQARLYRQFNRVGFRIAATENTRNINLIKYIAWLCDERHTPAEELVSTAQGFVLAQARLYRQFNRDQSLRFL